MVSNHCCPPGAWKHPATRTGPPGETSAHLCAHESAVIARSRAPRLAVAYADGGTTAGCVSSGHNQHLLWSNS